MSKRKPPKHAFVGQPHFRNIVKKLDGIRSMSGHNRRRIIEDWIALMFWAFLRHDPNYLEVLGRYDASGRKEKIAILFTEALAELVLQTELTGKECLGPIWMEYCANEYAGQYFTSADVCEAMAQITFATEPPKERRFTILDPACGAGGMLIASAQFLPREAVDRAIFIAMDIDLSCCMMTGLNIGLFNLHSYIFHGNSLDPHDCRGAWQTIRNTHCVPMLREIPLAEAKRIKLDMLSDKKPETRPALTAS